MPRLLSNVSETKFGNELSDIKFVKRVLLEFGLHNEEDNEIDRVITIAKVDMKQDEMKEEFKRKSEVPVREAQHTALARGNEVMKGPMDKYVVKVEPK